MSEGLALSPCTQAQSAIETVLAAAQMLPFDC